MEKAEHETIILINEGDTEGNGFFRFSTTRVHVFNRVMRRIEGDTVDNPVISYDIRGDPRCWMLKIPIKYLSRTTFGIGKPRRIQLSEEDKIKRAQRAKENFSNRNHRRE